MLRSWSVALALGPERDCTSGRGWHPAVDPLSRRSRSLLWFSGDAYSVSVRASRWATVTSIAVLKTPRPRVRTALRDFLRLPARAVGATVGDFAAEPSAAAPG